MTTVLNTPAQIHAYRSAVIESALRIYARTGMRVNRAYTPTNMLRVASEITGKTFRRGQYLEAADALRAARTPCNDEQS